MGGHQPERTGNTNAKFVCEIGNANTFEQIKFHTDFHVFFSCFNIELCVFNGTLSVELLEYTVPEENSLRFQSLSFFSQYILSFMHASTKISNCTSELYVWPHLHLPFNLKIFCHNCQTGKVIKMLSMLSAVSRRLQEKASS